MESPIPYWTIEDVNVISRWDAGQRFCIRITIPDGSVLLQVYHYFLEHLNFSGLVRVSPRVCGKPKLVTSNFSFYRTPLKHPKCSTPFSRFSVALQTARSTVHKNRSQQVKFNFVRT